MQNAKEERWRPLPTVSPSSRLRAARTMPPWLQARGAAVPPPPPPPAVPPPTDPDYEVIEFSGQQAYSNAPPPRPTLPGKPRGDGQRCDLCGSSTPAVRCEKCSQQNFCHSCDEMYHRHPKRQTHIRKPLDIGRHSTLRPPLPPKGENSSAPVPPPRRHKRSGRNTPVPPDQLQTQPISKPGVSAGVVGSLKRMMGGRPLPPAPPLARDPRLSISTSPLTFTELSDHQPPSRDSGYLDWEMDSRHRSGSLTALNAPGFTPLMHAQSMATLNCPSCHHHGMVWDWNMGGLGPPWGGGMHTNTWHGSAMLPPYRPAEEVGRRGSMRAPPRRSRRDLTTDDEDDHRHRNTSPVRSRRGPVSDDSEDEVMSHRSGRRHRRRTSPVSRNVSPALSRRSSRKKSSVGVEELIARRVKQNEEESLRSRRYDDETFSNRGSRRFDDETLSNRGGRRYDDDRMSVKSGRRQDIDEMSNRGSQRDDDLISNRGGRRYDEETLSNRGGRRRRRHSSPKSPGLPRRYPRNMSSEDSGDEMSDGMKSNLALAKKKEIVSDGIEKKEEEVNIPSDVDKPLGPVPTQEWECDHCTFVNPAGTRVCSVCCKTTINPKVKIVKTQSKQQVQVQSINQKPPEQKAVRPLRQDSSTSPLKEYVPQSQVTTQKETVNEQSKSQAIAKQQTSTQSEQTDTDLAERMKRQLNVSSSTTEKKKENEAETSQMPKTKISTGTSPPPQSISTQTYDVLQKPRLKRASSLADHEMWNNPHRNISSRQSVTSDSQSLPVTPPRAMSPEFELGPREWELRHLEPHLRSSSQLSRRPSEPAYNISRFSRRSGSQPTEYLNTLVQRQVKQGMEMVKLLREAEEQQFSADDLTVALAQCGDGDPVAWLRDNWRNMIDTVVTLATNYGHERKENTIGTISVSEARDALRLHGGNVWAAVTECVEQRQKKYADLMARGNFTREDIVTVLTANHGNLEAAFLELNKSQLKPFLMRIWGPPQGQDNESGNVMLSGNQADGRVLVEGQGQGEGSGLSGEVSDPNFQRIKSWLDTYVHQSIEAHEAKVKTSLSQTNRLSMDDIGTPRLAHSPLVDNQQPPPPEIPPRRRGAKKEHETEGDYENITKGEISSDARQLLNSSPTNQSVNSRDDYKENIQMNEEQTEIFINASLSKTGLTKEDVPETEDVDRINIPRHNDLKEEHNNSLLTKEDKKLSNEKQIVVEKLIIDGKVQEVRRFILDNSEVENYLRQNNNSANQIDSNSLIQHEEIKLEKVKPVDEDSKISRSSLNNKLKNNIPEQKESIQIKFIQNEPKKDIKSEQLSNSTSYESLCYSDDAPEEIEEPNIPNTEIVTTAKLFVKMDPSPISSVVPDLNNDRHENKINSSNTERKTELENKNSESLISESKNGEKSSNNVSDPNTSQIVIQKQFNKPISISNIKLNENQLQKPEGNKYNSGNLAATVQIEEKSNTVKKTTTTPTSINKIEAHRSEVSTKTFEEFEKDGSISPSASEIIADSAKNSRNVSPEPYDSEEVIEEYEEGEYEEEEEEEDIASEEEEEIGVEINYKEQSERANSSGKIISVDTTINSMSTEKLDTQQTRNGNEAKEVTQPELNNSNLSTSNMCENDNKLNENKDSKEQIPSSITKNIETNILLNTKDEDFQKIINSKSHSDAKQITVDNNTEQKYADSNIEEPVTVSKKTNEGHDSKIKKTVHDSKNNKEGHDSKIEETVHVSKNSKEGNDSKTKETVPVSKDKNKGHQRIPKVSTNSSEINELVKISNGQEEKNNSLTIERSKTQIPVLPTLPQDINKESEIKVTEYADNFKDGVKTKENVIVPFERNKSPIEIGVHDKNSNKNETRIENMDDSSGQNITGKGPQYNVKDESRVLSESKEKIIVSEIATTAQFNQKHTTNDRVAESAVSTMDNSKETNSLPHIGPDIKSNPNNLKLSQSSEQILNPLTSVDEANLENSSSENSLPQNTGLTTYISQNLDKSISQNLDKSISQNLDKINSDPKGGADASVNVENIDSKSVTSTGTDIESNGASDSSSKSPFAAAQNTSDRDTATSQLSVTTNSDQTHISTPSSMPEYVLNEALGSYSSEEDKQSSLGQNSVSTRGSSDKSQTSERSLSMIESRAEILELLKESLSSDLVLDRIVSTLFASVLNHSDSGEVGKPSDIDEIALTESDLRKLQTFSSSDSEVKTESDFFEAQEEVEDEEVEVEDEEVEAEDHVSVESEHEENIIEKEIPKKEIVVESVEKEEIITPEQQSVIDYERQVRRYLAEGIVSTYDQAELVVKLLELNFNKEASISAATECSSLQSALTFLQQDCQLCAEKYPMNQMISMLECEHRCCRDCALHYFTLQITERSINDCVCPFCKLPELHSCDPDKALDYFSNLDILLKGILEETVHELFQRKLRDRTLMQDPHFKWCVKCSSGFIANPRQKRLVCPDCRSVTCANCRRPWEKQHEGVSCDVYAAWLQENNDSETQISKHMADHGVTCPSCNNRYSLSKGGCMHLTCPQCKHEFCVGCGKPFSMGAKCQVSEYCAKLGLHAHHPRNCLFYLRDKEPQLLEKLLEDHGVEYKLEPAGTDGPHARCSVQLQRETPEGLLDANCGLAVEKAGLCRTHFIEYLVKLIGQHKLDPVSILDLTEVVQELRRRGKPLPIRASGQSDADYTTLCAQVVREQIPLD